MQDAAPTPPPPGGNFRADGHRRWLVLAAAALLAALPFALAYRATAAFEPPDTHQATPARVSESGVRVTVVRYAEFGSHRPKNDARQLADWIADSGDNAGTAFFIIDKHDARLYAFDRDARLLASSAILLGAALGDESVPGIGTRPIAMIEPFERTTPAGRFVAQRGHNTKGEDVVWVDYDAAISMHRVRATNPAERRLQRLATPEVSDNRISYGCINVPATFYDAHVGPTFSAATALVYVLPEVKALHEVFASYVVVPRLGTLDNSAVTSRQKDSASSSQN